ncbi:MAG: hypothetical protein SGCHY_003579 [Lobulomycetales sp.]
MHISKIILCLLPLAHGLNEVPEYLKLARNKQYDEQYSMLAYWRGDLPTKSPPIQRLDSMQTCLVNFGETQFESCASNAWTCCWQNKYDNETPNDNTDILEPHIPDVDTHCHGSAWTVKQDDDLQWRYRKEIFNHVVCEDHGFNRGYWGGIKGRNGKATLSCGCAEVRPKISRADCTQANEAVTGGFEAQKCQGETENDLGSWYEKLHGKELVWGDANQGRGIGGGRRQ